RSRRIAGEAMVDAAGGLLAVGGANWTRQKNSRCPDQLLSWHLLLLFRLSSAVRQRPVASATRRTELLSARRTNDRTVLGLCAPVSCDRFQPDSVWWYITSCGIDSPCMSLRAKA